MKRSNKSQRLENWGARRAAFRPHFFLPPKGWPFGDPGGGWTCSAEVNSACAKGDSAPLLAPPGAPHRRWGPRRERRKMPPGWAAVLKRNRKTQRLENWGARRAALRPYFFLPPKGWPFGDPGGDWTCSAEVNSACAKGAPVPLYAPPGAPHRRWGPRRERRKMPPGWAAFLKRSNKSQRLENWGARRAAFRPYFNRLSDDFP